MTDLPCPNCGNLNPIEAESCWFCHAALPLGKQNKPAGATLPENTEPAPQSPETSAVPAEIPDWLERIRQKNQVENELGASGIQWSPEQESNEDAPDWLKEIKTGSNTESPSAPSSETPPAADDWLSGLRTDETAIPAAEQTLLEIPTETPPPLSATTEASTAPAEEDWFSKISSWQQPVADTSSAQEEESPLPNSGMEPQQLSQPVEPAPVSDDWLGGLRGSSETTEPPVPPSEEPPAAAVPAEEMPDWFKDLSAREPQQPELEQPQLAAQEGPSAVEAQPGEIPSWLQGFRDLSTPASEDAAPSEASGSIAEQPAAEEPPDWLKDFAPQPSVSAESALPVEQPEPTLPPAEPVSDIPDWLQGFSDSAESATGEPAAAPAAGETPDWLQQTGQETPAEESAAPSGAVEPAAGEEDWFSRLSGSMNVVLGEETPAPSLPPAEASSEIPQESPEIPSWAQGTSESEDHAASAAPSSGVSDWWSNLTLPSEGEELPSAPAEAPDWISKIPTAHEQPPVPAPVESSAAEEIVPGSEEPEWLKDVHPETSSDSAEIEAPVGATPSNASPFAGADLPGWLDGVGPALTGTEGESGAPIEMGQLPEWLQAMRPVEAIGVGKTIDDLDREVVRSGPLAGLSGVLPGEKAAERYSKPPVYSAKLRVTDQQRSQAALLETLLAEIRAPRVAVSEPTTIPQRLLRMVIGLVLIAALLAPLLTQSQHVAIPAAAAQQSLDFYQSINSLPANVPVLVVVDYGLGLSGEMQVGAKALLGQLMDKPVRLAFVSSTPEGAALAQNLLTSVSAGHPAYSVDLQAVNLGFVPGDLTGLRQFGEQPWRAVPLTLDGKNPAEISALAGIQMLRDFSAVVVLTDNVDTGRAWVEQVQPLLGGKPMLMLVSAQAAPMLEPYYASGQVKGMLSGLNGSAVYGQLAQQPGDARRYWDAYQYGLIAIILIILIGGAIQFVQTLISRRKA